MRSCGARIEREMLGLHYGRGGDVNRSACKCEFNTRDILNRMERKEIEDLERRQCGA
jgi:hypothetical protein